MRFRLLGFPVTVDRTVLLIAGVFLLFDLQAQRPLTHGLTWIAVIFGSILVHELGHAVAARQWGRGPIEITLHGLGGLTRHRGSDHPWKDLVITLCGPGAGFALGGLALFFYLVGSFEGLVGTVVVQLVWVNLFWSAFNLIPVFPLDGGQAMAAVLRMVVPPFAWPITIGLGLAGGAILGLGATWLTFTGRPFAILLLLVAGFIVQQNWQLWRAWQDARQGRRPVMAGAGDR